MEPSLLKRSLRLYVIAVAAVCIAGMVAGMISFWRFISLAEQGGGWDRMRLYEATQFLPPLVFVLLLLVPWWRMGRVAFTVCFSLFLLVGLYVVSVTIFGLRQFHLYVILLSTAYVAHWIWLFKEEPQRSLAPAETA